MEKLEVYMEREDKKISVEIDNNTTINDLLKKLKINPIAVLVIKNNEVCLEKEKINSKDKIKIISVVSGG